jgi:hypothetical protein
LNKINEWKATLKAPQASVLHHLCWLQEDRATESLAFSY